MKNHVAVLEWWMTKAQALTVYGEVSVKKIASAALIGGALDVMRWCKETQGWNPLDVDIWSLRLAASSNHANALNWLESEAGTAGAVAQRIIQVDYTDPALQLAQLRRRLEAHTATGDGAELATPLDFRDAADFGAENGQVAVLEWIRGTGGSFLLERVVTAATERGHVAVLNWWRSHYPLDTWRPSDRSIWRAGFDGHVAVLQFWWDAGVEPASWSFEILRVAAERGFVSVFQWWAEHLQSPDTEQCLVIVEKAGRVWPSGAPSMVQNQRIHSAPPGAPSRPRRKIQKPSYGGPKIGFRSQTTFPNSNPSYASTR
ncbi:hypothetical protein DFJ73DRAFT_324838 [Zopfochytrium polystomum]|nr:hypothetical protein DFJ73DRAFT_324838 [Zopfochytrium polystomum]